MTKPFTHPRSWPGLERRRPARPLGLIAFVLVFAAAPTLAGPETASDVEPPPERVLVAPASVGPDVPADPILQALPALIAEGVNGIPGGSYTASLAHDLSPDTLEALGVAKGALPDEKALAAATAAEFLRGDGSIRLLLLPSVQMQTPGAAGAAGLKVTLIWRDLVAGKEGSVSQTSKGAGSLIDATRRALNAARRGWSAVWKAPTAPGAPAAPASAEVPSLQSLTSSVPSAPGAWARAGLAWNTGDVPGAESALAEALAADPNFAAAKVDLAWIRLAQGRNEEAAALAEEARRGKGRLSAAAMARAEVIGAASGADTAALDALRKKLSGLPPSRFPWGALAGGLARNLKGEHDPAVGLLDAVRLHRPNDPAVLHQSGIAALGGADPYEATTHFERAAALWPQHHRIWLDLAEARVRSHDLPGARGALQELRNRFQPSDAPIRGGSWSIEDPPPPVRAVSVDILMGSVSKAIETLNRESVLLEEAKAPAMTRVPVLQALYELDLNLAFGQDLTRQRWLNAAREALLALTDLMPSEEKDRRPWVVLRLEALLRVFEGRLPEARQIRDRIMAASALPGYDPGIEAEIEAAITGKAAEMEAHLAACRRAVQVRGSLPDLYILAEAHAIGNRWKEVDVQVRAMSERLETWSAARPRDAIFSSPRMSLMVPFMYSLGGLAGWHLGDVGLARGRWGEFLSYFREPDEAFYPFYREATDTGASPAW